MCGAELRAREQGIIAGTNFMGMARPYLLTFLLLAGCAFSLWVPKTLCSVRTAPSCPETRPPLDRPRWRAL